MYKYHSCCLLSGSDSSLMNQFWTQYNAVNRALIVFCGIYEYFFKD